MRQIFAGIRGRDLFRLWAERRKDKRSERYMRRMLRYKELLSNQQMGTDGDSFWNDLAREMAPSEDIQSERISRYESRIFVLRSILWEALEWHRGQDPNSDWMKIVDSMEKELAHEDYGIALGINAE